MIKQEFRVSVATREATESWSELVRGAAEDVRRVNGGDGFGAFWFTEGGALAGTIGTLLPACGRHAHR
jgi:hypothetical protein